MNNVSEVSDTLTPAAIRISVVEDFAALAPRKAEWNALLERCETNTIFQTYEFHESWWKVFGASKDLLVLLAHSGGELVGIAPLALSTQRLLWRNQKIVQFIGARSFDYADLIVDRARPEVRRMFLASLDGLTARPDVLTFRDIPGTSATLRELSAGLTAAGWRVDVRRLYAAPTRLFNDPEADRQLPNKKSLKRHYNYFKRAGRLELRALKTEEEVKGYLDRFFEQHVGRRSTTDTPSVFTDPRTRQFFRNLACSLAPQGWLLFSVVLFDDEPIAMHFGFEYDGRLTWYKPAFDMEFAKHSPGEVLIRHLLEYALEHKLGELDFTIGEEAFKYRFANHIRSNFSLRAYRRWDDHQLARLISGARMLVERFPALSRIARRALGRWRDKSWM